MRKVKLITICIVAAIAFLCITAMALLLTAPDRRLALEEPVLSKVAATYGVPKDWPSVRYAIYCVVFRRGKSISELEPELTRLGGWEKYGYADHFEYRLNGMSVGDKVFWVNTTLQAGKVDRISVAERLDQSDTQPISCSDGTYTYDYADRQTPGP